MNTITIKDELKEIEEYRKTFGHVGFIESGKLISFCNFLLSSIQEEIEQETDILTEFWSNIKNLENASLEDVQKDILAYLKQRQGYKNQTIEMKKALEWYANEKNYDRGKLAQQALMGNIHD